MQKLWTEDHVTYEGEYFKTLNATVFDKPTGKYIAGAGASAAKLAGRVADGFICTSGKAWDLYTETLLPGVQEGAEKAGRDYDSIEKLIEMKVSYDTDKQKALENTRLWAALALTPEQKISVHDPREMKRLADEMPIEQAASRWIVTDSADGVFRRIAQYGDGWIDSTQQPADIRTSVAKLESYAAEAGRGDIHFEIARQFYVSIAETEEAALANHDAAVPIVRRKEGIIGTPDQVTAQLQQFVDAGATELSVVFYYPNVESAERQLRPYAQEVMPAFS